MALKMFDVIRYEGENTRNILAWRHPKTDIKSGSTLIVNPGQCAILFSNGKELARFNAGKHKIEISDTQLLDEFKSFVSGGVLQNSSKLWFVNLYDLQPIGWGTPSAILVRDPETDIPVELKLHGNFVPRIVNLEDFLLEFMPSQPDLITVDIFQRRFRQATIGLISSAISKVVYSNQIAVIDIEMHSNEIGLELSKILEDHFDKYGIRIEEFNIESLKVNQECQGYKDIFKFHKQIVDAKIKTTSRDIEGYTYHEERKFDILEEAAKNENSNGKLMGVGMEVAMGLGIGAKLNNLVGNIEGVNQANSSYEQNQSDSTEEVVLAKFCSQCGVEFSEEAKFCSNCGQPR